MAPLLEVKNIVKTYAGLKAVDGISLAIEPGICFGLLGPNGAGKTTTIEMIEGIIRPTAGQILYKGQPPDAAFTERIGIQFQQTALLSFLTVRETLDTFQSLYNHTADLDALIDLCSLSEFQYQYNDRISGGQRQRFLLALALINHPELLFLDEPSTGLDPQARRNLWDIVRTVREQGKTIILTTHYMEEAEILCDQIAIIDYGKVIAHGSPKDLIRNYRKGVTVVLPNQGLPHHDLPLPFAHHCIDGRIEIETEDINACLKELIAMGADMTDIVVRSPNLEDVFITLTGRHLRD